ncbi:MAG: aminotransferase class V-fold PLP-dependent enzyme [Bacteroidota bacterium]
MSRLDTIREQFPITRQCFVNESGSRQTITYLDHGASTHPPAPVLDSYREFLERYYANIHRGNHYLSQKASELYDCVSEVVLKYIGGDEARNSVIFTSNTTTALDIASYLMQDTKGATLVSSMEHHSNDLPHRRRGAVERIEVLGDGTLDYEDLERKLVAGGIKLVAITGASNVTGYMPDIRLIARLAHANGARILVDGAQLLAHHAVDLLPNDDDSHIDFFAAAGHKAYAPFGTAFLVAPNEILERTEPYIPGGGTVKFVTDTDVVWAEGVERHTGGTPNIPGVIALGSALNWLSEIGLDWVRQHEVELLTSVESRLRGIEGVAFLGNIPVEKKLGVLPFNIAGIHHEQVAAILNERYGIATRNGCFCAHPYLTRLLHCTDAEAVRRKVEAGEDVLLPGAVRATIGIYNNAEDLDKLVAAVADLAAEALKGNTFPGSDKPSACIEAM